MIQGKGNRKRFIIVIALAVLVIGVVAVAVVRSMMSPQDPTISEQTTDDSATESTPSSPTQSTNEPEAEKPQENTSTLDPATVATVDIVPMTLTVSYVKGIGGFEYEVLRTPSGSQYVQFSSPELVGTKCTNDAGVFASILEDPSESEGATITKSVQLDNKNYGLSLAATNCTSDAAKLQLYQQSFNDAFSLLKKTN